MILPRPQSAPARIVRALRGPVLAVLLVPATALGQVGGMGSAPGMRGRPEGGGLPPVHSIIDPHLAALARAADPDNPLALIMAARGDLGLTDPETAALYTIRTAMERSQGAARTALDTLGPNTPLASIDLVHLTPAGRDSLIAHRKAVAAAMGAVHDAAVHAREAALAVLTDQQ